MAPDLPLSRNPLKRIYWWILSWAHHPAGTWALALFAFLDSSVFPIPPLFLQVALSIERPRRSWWYATVNTVASVLGATMGFIIGYFLFQTVGRWVIETYGMQKEFAQIGRYFGQNAFVFVLVYSFVPFPYKVITIGSGFVSQHAGHAALLPTLLVASVIGRGFRFFALAGACAFLGDRAKGWIDRWFNTLMVGIALFVLGVVLVMKLWLGR